VPGFYSQAAARCRMLDRMADVTKILTAIKSGDPKAAAELLPLVYNELRKLAKARLAAEKPGQTLDGTALVHEAYLRLVDEDAEDQWKSRAHFFGAAAEAMRRILIDRARKKQRPKHGGDRRRADLDELTAPKSKEVSVDLLALDEALTALAREQPAKADLVKLRYFAGLTLEEAAACLGISVAKAKRDWTVAKAWLFDALSDHRLSE